MRNPDIVCLPELPPGYRWDTGDGDFNINLNYEVKRKNCFVWVTIASRPNETEPYRLRTFGDWLSDPTEDLQALVDVTVARFWIGDLPP